MRQKAKHIFDYLIFSHLFVALCAVAQAALTYLLIGQKPDEALLLIIFFASVFVYNFRVILYFQRIKASQKNSTNHRVRFVSRHSTSILTIALVAALLIVPLSFFLKIKTIEAGLLTGIIALSYSLPFIAKLKGGLRQVPGLKTFLVAGVWALGTVLLPILQAGIELHLTQIIILFAKRFVFIFVLALLFDLRDIDSDRKFGLKTLATLLGPAQTKILCLFLLASQLFLIINFNSAIAQQVFIGLLASSLLTSYFVILASSKRNDYFCLFWVDGLMITHYLLVLAAVYFL
ncbi:UbiA family prenyltransferase [Solitalea koreensis]|uniref:4-hydroxybenzoate polyprenyltransferase n=1 Tax=Solitalea koreensis TaxID=543615 RepID=A0A521AUW3_9SPHI|nr:UbiA family prenyltransferase [Solitalea koreensis]SMO38599.1 4-hydroxybenzoate polyprenyltransferase [Solitalea koreensis]